MSLFRLSYSNLSEPCRDFHLRPGALRGCSARRLSLFLVKLQQRFVHLNFFVGTFCYYFLATGQHNPFLQKTMNDLQKT